MAGTLASSHSTRPWQQCITTMRSKASAFSTWKPALTPDVQGHVASFLYINYIVVCIIYSIYITYLFIHVIRSSFDPLLYNTQRPKGLIHKAHRWLRRANRLPRSKRRWKDGASRESMSHHYYTYLHMDIWQLIWYRYTCIYIYVYVYVHALILMHNII